MESITLNGTTWLHVASLAEASKITYHSFGFNPVTWGMSIAFWSTAIWLVIDLVWQLHATFRRWGGMYYWTVLCTSIGIGIHATMLLVKAYCELSTAEGFAATIILKVGEIMGQTGFSLVLYSRLSLVMRSSNPNHLRWILLAIIIGSSAVIIPLLVFNLGAKMPGAVGKVWFARNMTAERVLLIYFTLQELVLSSLYTWTTAKLVRSTALRKQPAKTRRNLLLFMVFAQVFTFCADLSMLGLLFAQLLYKGVLHPFFYGVKLKIEFMALNQLQSLVQPEARLFTLTGDPNLPSDVHQAGCHPSLEQGLGAIGKELANGDHVEPQRCSPRGIGTRTSGVHVSCIETETESIENLERQYLGRHGQ